MTAIVLTMLVASTALVMISFEVYLVQLPYIGIANAPEVERQLVFYETGRTWLIRLNVRPLHIHVPSSRIADKWDSSIV